MRDRWLRAVSLAVAAAALLASCGREARRTEKAEEVLATVGRERITRADLERRMGQLPEATHVNFDTPERQAELLNMLVEEKLILLAAEAKKLEQDPELAARLADARAQLVNHYYSEKVLLPLARPDSAEVARYYRENPEEFHVEERVTGRQIVVASEGEARTIRRHLLRGASFDSLVKARSIDPQTKNLGGAIGYVSRGAPVRGLGPNDAFVEALMVVPVGEISEPIKTSKGYHVVRVEGHEPERVRELGSVEESLVRKLVPTKFQDIRRHIVDSLRQVHTVKVDTLALLGDDAYRRAQAKELFDRAQNTEDPAARLKTYEQILAQHGDSEYAAQAQFMIGFIYADELKDKERARTALTAVIERYPNSELVDSARWMLKNMDGEVTPLESGNKGSADQPRGGKGSD